MPKKQKEETLVLRFNFQWAWDEWLQQEVLLIDGVDTRMN